MYSEQSKKKKKKVYICITLTLYRNKRLHYKLHFRTAQVFINYFTVKYWESLWVMARVGQLPCRPWSCSQQFSSPQVTPHSLTSLLCFKYQNKYHHQVFHSDLSSAVLLFTSSFIQKFKNISQFLLSLLPFLRLRYLLAMLFLFPCQDFIAISPLWIFYLWPFKFISGQNLA